MTCLFCGAPWSLRLLWLLASVIIVLSSPVGQLHDVLRTPATRVLCRISLLGLPLRVVHCREATTLIDSFITLKMHDLQAPDFKDQAKKGERGIDMRNDLATRSLGSLLSLLSDPRPLEPCLKWYLLRWHRL
ncbi:hypothetical protein F4861DRAFT_515197 [Xylaria intraflava]|nr:hypothetical protein F4861DRAFT_515197 [Xylaria intraflava]